MIAADLRRDVDAAIMRATERPPSSVSVKVDQPIIERFTSDVGHKWFPPGSKTVITVEITH